MATPSFEKLRLHFAAILVLLLATAAVYGRLLSHDFQNVDDQYYVTQNPVIAGFSWQHLREVFSAFYVGNYAPIQMLSYMLDYTLWGMWAGGFLLGNILIHSVSGLLVYRLSLRLHGDRFFSTVAAGLFLLHPVQVESVAWISQRKTLLSMLFFLVAWECYCRYREAGPGSRVAYLLSLSAFVLSLLSKSIAVILPVVLVMFDYCYPQGKRRLLSFDKIPFLLLAVAIAGLTIYGQQPEVGQGGRVEGFHGDSARATFYTMLTVLCRYLGMMAWPAALSAEYNPAIHSSPDIAVLGAVILLLLLVLGGWRLYRHDRRLGFWPLFLLVALLPVSQIIPLYTLMNDRYLYFPLLSVAFLGGSAASAMLHGFRRSPRLAYLLAALPLMFLAVAAHERAGVWRDPVTLWTDAVSKVPDSSRIWGNLGDAYAAAGDRRSASAAFERGLELNPDNVQILFNYGNMSLHSGDKDKAYALLKRLLDQVPDHVMGLVSFGDILLLERDFARAEKSYLLAHQWQPEAADPLVKLGNIAVVMQRLDDARDYYLKAAGLAADNPDIAYNIACVESLSGRPEAALLWLDKALQRGFDDEYALRTNKELELVRGDGRFERLLLQYFPGKR